MEGNRLRHFKGTWEKWFLAAAFFIELLILWGGLYALACLLTSFY